MKLKLVQILQKLNTKVDDSHLRTQIWQLIVYIVCYHHLTPRIYQSIWYIPKQQILYLKVMHFSHIELK